MNIKIFIVLLSVMCLQCVDSLNILGIFPHMGRSHFTVFRVYLQELAKRGHNLTIVSYFPETNPVKNYHDISLPKSAGKGMPVYEQFNIPIIKTYLSLFHRVFHLMNIGMNNCKVLLANKDVQTLITEKQKFDLVIAEQFNSDCPLGVAYKLQAPVIIGINSHVLMPWHYRRFDIPRNPSFVPYLYLHGGTRSSLLQKIEVTIVGLFFDVMYHFYEQRGDQNTLAEYFDDIPPMETLARDIKLMLVYHNFVLAGSRLLPANVIEVGGFHVAEPKPLPEDLQHFIGDADNGVIYISFGTGITSKSLDVKQVQVILEVTETLPQKFIWKWDDPTIVQNKTKLHISDWLPQVDILGNAKTVAFFSHAGMAGTTEAIHFGVPMLAMPFFGDQPSNAAAIEECGLGVRVYLENLTKENLLAAFRQVLQPDFRENVKRVSAAWHDRPLSPLQSAVHWTEFAARHHNFTFRTPAADLPFYQYYNLDVVFVYVLFALVLFVIFKKCFARNNHTRIANLDIKKVS